ncbi:MAG TPA: hypothetical protein VLH40_05165 [Atribacteraceae bacterium]|nr:hypothetical protein [Atribacteraceae bacterium]
MSKAKHVTEELSKEPNQTDGINPDRLDPLTEVLRKGAGKMLQLASEVEVEEFMAQHQWLKDEQGHQAIVRNGYLPERKLPCPVFGEYYILFSVLG